MDEYSPIPLRKIDGDVDVGRNVAIGGDAIVQGKSHYKGDVRIDGWLDAENIKGPNKGLFTTLEGLKRAYPHPKDGWWAIVSKTLPGPIYVGDKGQWIRAGGETSTDVRLVSVDKTRRADEAEHAKTADVANYANEAGKLSNDSDLINRFVSKEYDDTVKGVIAFLKGIVAKAVSFFQGIVNRGDINNNGDITNTGNISNAGDITNKGNIMTKNLTVTGKATFFELEIQKAKAAGGIIIQSAATFKIDDAEETTDGYVCYQRAEKDGVKLFQMCELNDQMLCYGGMNVNVGANQHVSNHFYWRLVIDAPTTYVTRNINGEEVECLKIVLSRTDFADKSDVPLIGDEMAQVGNRTNTDRQSVIVNSAYKSIDGELKAPYWVQYSGVNDYKLSTHKRTWFAANGSQVTGNFKVQSAGGGLKSIEDYVKGIATDNNMEMWNVSFSIRNITGKQGETFRLKVVRIVGDKAEEVDGAALSAAGASLLLFSDDMGMEIRVQPGVDYFTANYGHRRYFVARVVRNDSDVTLAQDTIYAEAEDGKPGKDAVIYKLLPTREVAVAYKGEGDKGMVSVGLAYRVQKSVGDVSTFVSIASEGMALDVAPAVGTFVAKGEEYALTKDDIPYTEQAASYYRVTLTKGSNIVDQRIVAVTFKPKVVFDIDTEQGKITSRIETAEGKVSLFEQDIKKTQITVGKLNEQYSQLKVKSDEISLTVNNGTRPNLLWGSDLNLDGVDTTNKAAIEKHLGIVISDGIELGNRDMFEYLKGEGVGGSDAIRFKNAYKREGWRRWTNIIWKDVPLKPHTRYTISVWVKFKSYGKKGRMYVDCNSDDGRWNFGGYLHSEHHYSREDIDKWTRVKYVFDSGESRKIKDLFFACIADEEDGAQCEIWLCHPKLEEGNTETPWCAYDGTTEALLASGLDVKEKKFTATADNFKVQNNRGEQTFLVDKDGHINANLISAESISAQKIAQPFVEQNSFEYLMSSPSLSWYITNGKNINDRYVLASELNGAVLNIYNYTTETIWFYSTFAAGETTYSNKTVNVRVEIEAGAMFRAIGVPINGVEMAVGNKTTTLVALVPLVPMELTRLSGNMRAKYTGVVKGFLTIK